MPLVAQVTHIKSGCISERNNESSNMKSEFVYSQYFVFLRCQSDKEIHMY